MSNKKQSQLRISAGRLRGRKVTFPNVSAIRPTTDRIRETVFNWLNPYLENARCLDAFAGSGILGFEALSRLAKEVSFIDHSKINIQSIINNTKKLDMDAHIKTYREDFFKLATHILPFDVIFLDPPYHQKFINNALTALIERKWINSETVIYIEGEKNISQELPKRCQIIKEKATRAIYIALIKMRC